MANELVALVPTTSGQMVAAGGAEALLSQIRPSWQAKSLISRVKALLPVDPSSACQRLLNAAIHDLREKIVIAGLDVAQDAASLNKLPSVTKPEDVQEYSTTHTLDLAYHMGLIARPEWRKLKRTYEIRKDLEHEDDQYEAGVEDCFYVFRTCIEIVLSRDPISPVKVVDVKDIINSPALIAISKEVLTDFEGAPDKRQLEIFKFLISTARDEKSTDIVRQNAIESLRAFKRVIRKSAQSAVGQFMQEFLKSKPIGLADMKISATAGITPYLKQAKVAQYFEEFLALLNGAGHSWKSNEQHGKLLDDFDDLGGLHAVPPAIRKEVVLWMVRCYIGEPGGYGHGFQRPVFFSNVAAPRILSLFRDVGEMISGDLEEAGKQKIVNAAVSDKHVARRFEKLRDTIVSKP